MNSLIKIIFTAALGLSLTAQALTLDEYLNLVKQKNRLFSAYDLEQGASNDRKDAGDLILAPQLTAGYSLTTDKSQPSSLITLGSERKVTNYNVGVAKNFSTGTAVQLTGRTDQFENKGAVVPLDQYSTGSLGISLRQSIWKDFFGAGTRLRRERESAVNKFENLDIEYKKISLLIEAESSFWDYAVSLENLNLKKSNYDRSKKLSTWTSNRVSNGISDRSDLMSIRALNSQRELELALANDDLRVQELRIRQNLDLAANEPTPPITTEQVPVRPYFANMANKKNIIRIDSYMANLNAQAKKFAAKETRDASRPDLALVGAYNTSSFNRDYNQMQNDISKTELPKTFIGVNFAWAFGDAKNAQMAAADKAALAAQLNAERSQLIGRDAWFEHVRRYEVAKLNVTTLEKIAEYQRERAKAEQDKFSKGRTVTLNVVTAETDAATAEVAYLNAKSNLRKLEALTQLYISVEE